MFVSWPIKLIVLIGITGIEEDQGGGALSIATASTLPNIYLDLRSPRCFRRSPGESLVNRIRGAIQESTRLGVEPRDLR